MTETIKTVVYALLLAGLFRSLLFQPFWIPSGSMKETLLIGDFLFVNKMSYGYSRYSCPFSWLCPFSGRLFASEPERGDVIVFKHPVNKADYIKRLVGLPGDTIQMKDGILHINGKSSQQVPAGLFEEPFAGQGSGQRWPMCENNPNAEGGECTKSRFLETFPDGSSTHVVLNAGSGSSDNTNVFTVPPGEYFFMGDNRDNSQDSRRPQSVGGVGTVPFENFIGRADRVMFSSAGRFVASFWAWRKNRFFKAIE